MLGTGTRVKSRRRVLLALWLLVQLLAGQQLALAHMIGHIGTSPLAHAALPVPAADDGDGEHGAALVLSHVCTTCIALAGVDVAPPASRLPCATAAGRSAAPAVAVPPAPTLRFVAAFRSRAPPLL